MKKILIIGGAGYIGCHVVDIFLKKNFEVICLDNFIYNHTYSIKKYKRNKNFKIINYDISKKNLVKKIPQELDGVIILAGLVGDPITKKYSNESNKINYLSIKKLINFFKDKSIRLIFISSCSNYGVKKEIADEKSKLAPKSLYALQKVMIEKYILSLKKKSNFTPTILRFATAFGASNRPRFDLTVNEFVLNAFLKKKIEIYDHKTWRPYCHVKDFANIIFKCIDSKINLIKFQIFNVGSYKNNCRKIDLAKIIKKNFPKFEYEIVKNSNDPRDYRVNFEKIKKTLKIKSFLSIQYGIHEIKNYLRKNKNNKKLLFYGNYKLK